MIARQLYVTSPRDLSVFQSVAGLFLGPFVEHSPIYTTYQIDYTIVGDYTIGSFDYSLDYSGSKTWVRVPISASGTAVVNIPETFLFQNDILAAAIVSPDGPSDNEMVFGLLPSIITTDQDLYSPQYPAADIDLGGATVLVDDAVIGTRTNNGASPPTESDITADIALIRPSFSFDGVSTARDIINRVSFGGIKRGGVFGIGATHTEDVSGWGVAKWHDFRGVYTASDTDINGVVTTVTITIS